MKEAATPMFNFRARLILNTTCSTFNVSMKPYDGILGWSPTLQLRLEPSTIASWFTEAADPLQPQWSGSLCRKLSIYEWVLTLRTFRKGLPSPQFSLQPRLPGESLVYQAVWCSGSPFIVCCADWLVWHTSEKEVQGSSHGVPHICRM